MEHQRAVRVVLADDSYLVREALVHVLNADSGIEIVATCGDLDTLLATVDSEAPDVVVSDIRMPPTHTDEGLVISARLRRSHPQMGVVILSQYAEARYGLQLLEDGSDGRAYLLKERIKYRGQLTAAIESVAHGGRSSTQGDRGARRGAQAG